MFLESKEQNYVKNKNNIDPQSSVISTNEAMTSSALNTRIAAMNVNSSNFQTIQQPQNSNLQTNQINNQIMLSSSIDSTTTSSSSYSTSSSTNLLNTKQPNGFNSRDRTHLKLDLKDGDSYLNGNNINNNGISPLSLPISLLDSASLLLSPEKILLAAHHQQQQQQQQQQKLETPTPSTILFPKVVTSEQEKFAEGLQKALQEFQGKDTSLTHFPATSPSAVKLLLSLARTPSSPTPLSTTKSTNNLLQSVTVSPNNNITITNSTTTNNLNTTTLNSLQKQQTFDLPKILVNQQQKQTVLSNTVIDPSQTETANSIIAKRFMEYFQLNQAAAAISATSPTSSINFNSHTSQLHQNQQLSTSSVSATLQPLLNTQTTSNNNSGIQKYLNNTSFIKKEPNQPLNCDEQMEILIDTQMPNSCPLSNDSNRHSSSISNESSPRMNGKINVIPNGNTLNGYDGVIELGEHDLKKLERKRARNRLAASKCRQRKLQRIADLEKQVEDERKREKELQAEIVRLQNVIKTLQEKLSGYRH